VDIRSPLMFHRLLDRMYGGIFFKRKKDGFKHVCQVISCVIEHIL